MLCVFMMQCHSRGLNFNDLEHSQGQKKFEAKLMAQQNVIDSMANIYKGQRIAVNTVDDNNGDPTKIILYNATGFKNLDTLKPGDTVLLIDVLPEYKFRKDSIVKVLNFPNAIVKTKKGVTGRIKYFYIQAFEDELKEKGFTTTIH